MLRQKLKELQLEAAEEKGEVDALIEELSKEIIELCVGLLACGERTTRSVSWIADKIRAVCL